MRRSHLVNNQAEGTRCLVGPSWSQYPSAEAGIRVEDLHTSERDVGPWQLTSQQTHGQRSQGGRLVDSEPRVT